MKTRLTSILLLALAAVMLLSACTGGEHSYDTDTDPVTEAIEQTTEQPTEQPTTEETTEQLPEQTEAQSTQSFATEQETEAEKSGGCGSVVAAPALVLVALIGTALIAKKKD